MGLESARKTPRFGLADWVAGWLGWGRGGGSGGGSIYKERKLIGGLCWVGSTMMSFH